MSFSPEEDALILHGAAVGMSDRDIADHIFCAISLMRARRATLLAPKGTPRASGGEWRSWTTQDLRRLKELMRSTMSFAEIAREMNRTPAALKKKAYSCKL